MADEDEILPEEVAISWTGKEDASLAFIGRILRRGSLAPSARDRGSWTGHSAASRFSKFGAKRLRGLRVSLILR